MTKENTDPFAKLAEMVIGKPKKGERFCTCGTCEEAYVAARDGAVKLLENQCPTWLMQVGLAYVTIAGTALLHMQEVDDVPAEMRVSARDLFEVRGLMNDEMVRWSFQDIEATKKLIERAYAKNS